MTQKYPSLELKDLEDKLDQLIAQYQSVKNENNSLKSKQEVLVMEKATLLEKLRSPEPVLKQWLLV